MEELIFVVAFSASLELIRCSIKHCFAKPVIIKNSGPKYLPITKTAEEVASTPTHQKFGQKKKQ